ncbi:DUF2169 domain-containing protein [Sorangium sp. So ce281]|uniref:DUF2169 family type VI secretion system accessory protein n=1 Tax=unclassified Sorangium TaxID=2621164 RepID=UPI003F633E14
MDVHSCCPLRAAALRWQPRPGSHALTVICKAAFELRPGESPLADAQEEPLHADAHWQNDPRRSLRAAGDRVPFKRRADVLVLGHAFAPAAAPVTSLAARIAVGSIDKSIEMHADRAWTADGRILVAEPFARAPLTWERASWGANNPAGIAPSGPPDERGLRPIPNIVPRGFVLRSPADPIPAVGLGPIAPTWYPRAALLGRYASTWDHRAWNARPLSEDFDGAFFNAAPLDQQLAELRGDETIVLENLHPTYAQLTTKLSTINPLVTVRRASGDVQDVRLRVDTLCIDTDRAIATLVWRGMVLLGHAGETGAVMVTMEGPALAAEAEGTVMLVGPTTTRTADAAARSALPFVQAAGPIPTIHEMARQPATSRRDDDEGTGTLWHQVKSAAPALPFQSTAAPAPPAAVAMEPTALDQPLTTWSSHEVAGDRFTEAPRRADVAPPAMIGPLAKADTARAPVEASTVRSEQAASTPEPTPIEAEEPPVDLTLEETATIAAELAEGKTERAEILDAHGVGERAWRANERRWNEALAEEQGRGKSALRGAYDAAYAARVEKFRGPVTLEEYARILVGIERGRANGVLDALKIQRPALMPIVRVWAKRVAKDVKLSQEATKALREAKRA